MIAALLAVSFATLVQDQPARSAVVQNTANLAVGERLVVRRGEAGIEMVSATRVGAGDAIPPAGATQGEPGANPLVRTEAGTLSFSLGGGRETGSILRVENATDQPIAYTAYIVRYVGSRAHPPARTNVCSVPAGLASFEVWPEPVIQVVIGDIRTSDSAVPVCEAGSVAD